MKKSTDLAQRQGAVARQNGDYPKRSQEGLGRERSLVRSLLQWGGTPTQRPRDIVRQNRDLQREVHERDKCVMDATLV